MGGRDYDTGDHDTCPHNTFSGCDCYGRDPVDDDEDSESPRIIDYPDHMGGRRSEDRGAAMRAAFQDIVRMANEHGIVAVGFGYEGAAVEGREVMRTLRDEARDEERAASGRPLSSSAKRARSAGRLSVVLRFDDVEATTSKAILVRFGEREVWLPRSEAEILPARRVIVPRWLADNNKLTEHRC